jgi:hypothetical protein
MTPHPYSTRDYAASLGQGEVLPVAPWDGAALLARPIGASGRQDVAGPYPLLPFAAHWPVAEGLDTLRATGAVSAVFVTDPLGAVPPAEGFALARPYKRHFLVTRAAPYAPEPRHRSKIRRAAEALDIGRAPLAAVLDAWRTLYAGLVAEKGLAGSRHDFPAAHFSHLAAIGAEAWTACRQGSAVAMYVWLRHGADACYHLGASAPEGLALGASFAVMDRAIHDLLADGAERLLLGGGLAPIGEPPCGLTRFKAGFANAEATSWLLGAILDAPAYAALGGDAAGGFFPAYRAPALARAA